MKPAAYKKTRRWKSNFKFKLAHQLGPTVITIDIETVVFDNVHTPYLIYGYNNGREIYRRAKDLSSESVKSMFHNFIKQLVSLPNVTTVYAHNLAGFDGILLFKELLEFNQGVTVEPIIHNSKCRLFLRRLY